MNQSVNWPEAYAELEKGMGLTKCRQCGCMREVLDDLMRSLPPVDTAESRALLQSVLEWNARMKPVQYSCLGCAVCHPAVAQNAIAAALPDTEARGLSCDFHLAADWPVVAGEYVVPDKAAHVAVTTLANADLPAELARRQPRGLAITGKTETENIGIDKLVKNVIANPSLQYLVLAGHESAGHRSGSTLLALAANGVDAGGRVIGSVGKRPILRNVSPDEIEAFRRQVQLIDMIGCESVDEISARIESLPFKEAEGCG